MPPSDAFNPQVGHPEQLQKGLRRIVAPNPSPMTFRGTNTYLVGDSDLAVIDPGPQDNDHLAAILAAVQPGQRITHIIVSHAHRDHAPLARALQVHCGAPVYAFGPADAGRSAVMQQLAQSGLAEGGEGVDTAFAPDHLVADGDLITGGDWRLRVLHTPGHMGNHICLAWDDICFTADHVMGWSSSMVSPPDGDLTDFMASCNRMKEHPWQRFYPGHGDVVTAPLERLDWLVNHRLRREAEILHALQSGPADAVTLTDQIYGDISAPLTSAASRNVLAHLIDLIGKNKVMPQGPLASDAQFRLIQGRSSKIRGNM